MTQESGSAAAKAFGWPNHLKKFENMGDKQTADIGEAHWHGGNPYFIFGRSGNGLIFKDCYAYDNDWDAPCYVPEYAAEGSAVTIRGVKYECGGPKRECDWYSHNDLLSLCGQDHAVCDALFGVLDWRYPETLLDEMGFDQ